MRSGEGAPLTDPDIVWPHVAPKSPAACPVTRHAPGVVTVDGVLTHAECAALVAATEPHYVHQGSAGPAAGQAVRSCGRVAVTDACFAAALWRALRGPLAAALAAAGERDAPACLNPHIRAYRYAPGDEFRRHYDDAEAIQGAGVTRYTLLLYLTGGVRGGATVFYTDGRGRKAGAVVAAVEPVAGRALLHRHGDACLPHAGSRVVGGVKVVLRSDVVYAC